jgi:hypothetical protein
MTCVAIVVSRKAALCRPLSSLPLLKEGIEAGYIFDDFAPVFARELALGPLGRLVGHF